MQGADHYLPFGGSHKDQLNGGHAAAALYHLDWGMSMEDKRQAFTKSVLEHMNQQHTMDFRSESLVEFTVNFLFSDLGAAQDFLDAHPAVVKCSSCGSDITDSPVLEDPNQIRLF